MISRSSFLLLLFALILISLAACAPAQTSSPPADQAAVATIVAATQTALAASMPPTIPPTVQPTLAEPAAPPATPKVVASPTTEPTPSSFIAYIKGGNVFVWTENAGSMPLTDTRDAIQVRISGDGTLVAYLRQDPADMFKQELWLANVNALFSPQVLVSNEELAALKPAEPNPYIGGIGILDFAWRAHTHELVYDTLILHGGPGFSPNHDLRLVDADSLEKTTLLEKGEGGLFYFSPDGSQLALSRPESISLINADGTSFRQDVLTFPEVVTYSEYQYHPHPIWAADSSSLRVTVPPADPLAEPLAPTGLWLIPTDGSPGTLLGEVYAMPFAWPDNAFSPSLERVIYAMRVGDPADNQHDLHIADPDGSNDTVYDSGTSLEFRLWAPDSQHFIYAINSGDRQGLYVGAPDNQPARIFPDPHLVSNIQWLDDTRFACLLAAGEQWELRITDLDGADLALIDTLPDSSPSFDVRP